METLDLIRAQEKEFDKKFLPKIFASYPGWKVSDLDEVQSFHRTSLIAIFEEEVRRLEENRRYTHNSVSIESTPYPAGWNDCLDQQIAHYQTIIEELKK